MDEVAQHKTKESLWVVINRKVYDVTTFYKRHPGGPQVILQMAGKDATAASAAAHKNALPANLMWEFCIGSLVRFKAKLPEPEPIKPAPAPKAAAAPKAASAPKFQTSTAPRALGPAQKVEPKAPAPATQSPTQVAAKVMTGGAKLVKKGVEVVAKVAPKKAESATSTVPTAATTRSPKQAPAKSAPSDHADHHSNASAERASTQGDLDDDLAHSGKDSIKATALFIVDKMIHEPSLASWAGLIDSGLLEAELHKLLSGVFEGSEWPPLGRKRYFSIVDAHFSDIMESLGDAIRGPMPLGEDPVTYAVAKIAAAEPEKVDERIERFFEALRDLVFAGGGSSKAPSLKALAGTWRNSDGLLCIVADDKCTFNSKITSTITVENGALVLNSWECTSVTPKSVMWQKANKTMEWLRAEAPKAKVPNGVWLSSENNICTVEETVATSTTSKASSFGTLDGMPTLNGWRASSVSPKKIEWVKNGKRMEWKLLEDAKEVPVLNGTWKNDAGLVCTVQDGQCKFNNKGTYPLGMTDGILTLNSWRATAIMTDTVHWQKGDAKMRWARLPEESN